MFTRRVMTVSEDALRRNILTRRFTNLTTAVHPWFVMLQDTYHTQNDNAPSHRRMFAARVGFLK